MDEIKEPKKGQPIEASVLAANARALRSMRLVAQKPLYAEQTADGTLLRFAGTELLVVRITGAPTNGVYGGMIISPNGAAGFYDQVECKAKLA